MRKIPILGTQTLNSVTNLKNLINSIDYPVELLSVVVNNENFDVLLEVKEYCDNIKNDNIEKIDISFHPSNLGCPASWNYHFKQYPYADFYIKADDDDVFSPNDLSDMVKCIEEGAGFVKFKTGYTCFGITKDTLKKVGLFDENYFPCNYEDDDYTIRLNLSKIIEFTIDRNIKHIWSGTSRNLLDPTVEHAKMAEYIIETEEYFIKKWGGRFPVNYKTPFNNIKKDIKNIDYNFEYRERKIFRCNYTK